MLFYDSFAELTIEKTQRIRANMVIPVMVDPVVFRKIERTDPSIYIEVKKVYPIIRGVSTVNSQRTKV